MKLASLNQGRDGQLIVVSRDLRLAVYAHDIAPTLQFALDNWSLVEAPLHRLYQQLNDGMVTLTFPFNPNLCSSPLPRAYQWADGSAYVNHVELVRKARGAEMPESFWTDPLIYQGMSDRFYAPTSDIPMADESWGIDFEGEIAVITDDVPMGIRTEEVHGHIKLLMLVNDVSLRQLIPSELAKGFGFFQSKPSTAFSPVAVTPDELGEHWHDYKVHHRLQVTLNNELFGQPHAGTDMTFNFAELIQHAAKSRALSAGSIIGSGTVSNRDRSQGSCCIAERRMLETLEYGEPRTPFMAFGDTVRIDMTDDQGQSIFGAIEQTVTHYTHEYNAEDLNHHDPHR
ncbi:fumarylacetoacetate hydrolase family protein [Photobacterium aphoticum]|uniref:2-keto-4-pentenoate hydratase n=1 Tax=Photobacterium aphoticum TaxID=754436 RepID=A0A0J1GK27_9GAMM|nr:fumarylacetoacetate hydrolase family protein [Photobacterium aphoticum]KLU99813.1 2-keto-4-pentenoate hydratase [Photobacterium aphoticum]PSU59500.1 FAA hydrolase family protein [Photobacterium aphoticum]GHA40230.1 2-keto-4-pentenoate hydratase [Photobacterium aphoticum]